MVSRNACIAQLERKVVETMCDDRQRYCSYGRARQRRYLDAVHACYRLESPNDGGHVQAFERDI